MTYVTGIDTDSTDGLNLVAARNRQIKVIFRYVAPQSWRWEKVLTPQELEYLTVAGFTVVPVWESSAISPLGGYGQGITDGMQFAAGMADLPSPKGFVRDFAAVAYDWDFDPSKYSRLTDYSRGFAESWSGKQIPYGGGSVIAHLQEMLPSVNVGGWKCASTGYLDDPSAEIWIRQQFLSYALGIDNDVDFVDVAFWQTADRKRKDEDMSICVTPDGVVHIERRGDDNSPSAGHELYFRVTPDANNPGGFAYSCLDVTDGVGAAGPNNSLYTVSA